MEFIGRFGLSQKPSGSFKEFSKLMNFAGFVDEAQVGWLVIVSYTC
jgi:hypothetical protein